MRLRRERDKLARAAEIVGLITSALFRAALDIAFSSVLRPFEKLF
jgi:hypothetical protein